MIMKRYIYAVFLAIVAIFGIVGMVIAASDITDAVWHGEIRATNNGTSTATSVAVPVSINSTAGVSNGFWNSTLLDIALLLNGTDYAIMPGYGTNPWMIFVQSIGSNQNIDYDLYTGNVTGGSISYFPDSSGMTIPDDASMEISDNFSIILDAFLGNSGNLTSKGTALLLNYDGNSTVMAELPSIGWASPTSYVDGGNWSNETNAYDDDTGTYASRVVGPQSWSNYLELDIATANVTDIRIWITRSAVVIDDMDLDVYYNSAWQNIADAMPDLGEWESYSLGDTYEVSGMRARFYNSHPDNVYNAYWNEADFYALDTAVLTGTTSNGEHTITLWEDGSNAHLSIDGIETDNTTAVTIADNSDNWTIGSDATSYINSYKHYVGGNLVSDIVWEYDTTFTDLSGNGNDATPSFRTSSSDADVSADLISFLPVSVSEVSTFTLSTSYSVLSGTPSTPDNIFDDGDYTKLPSAPINTILDAASVPRAAWWLPFLFLGICVIGLIVYGVSTLTHSPTGQLIEGQIDGSLVIMVIVMEALLWVFGKMGPIPYWPCYIFPIGAIAIIMSKKHYSWG